MATINNRDAEQATRDPKQFRDFEVTPGRRVVIYDDPGAAAALASELNTWHKTSELRGNPNFKTFSVVGLPAN